ncbi:MAG: hypothetical protein AB1584_00930 [Pseudomonadota bacterium]
MIKSKLIGLALLSTVVSPLAAVEITANTRFFNLTNWAYKDDTSPDMLLYNVAGFYIANAPLTSQRVAILPSIRYSANSVQFISKNGMPIEDISSLNPSDVETVEVTLWYNGNLPNREQSIGIVSQLGTNTIRPVAKYIPFDFNFINNPSYVNWGLPHQMKMAIHNDLMKLQQDTAQAENLYAAWQSRLPQVVVIKNATVRAVINGEIVGETSSSNWVAPSGALPMLYLKGLSPYQINRIRTGGMELSVEYTFQDTRTSSINAQFDFKAIMQRVIDDSYSRVITRKTSGFQFLGMGSKKSTMKERIKQALTDQTSGGTYGQTMIQMDDADESQIAMFTERFFPTLSRDQVIENHMNAAAAAQSEGKTELAETHRKYAEDLRAEKLDLSVDTAAALAALNKDDYVGFIAHGLKIGSAANKGTFEYHRVLNSRSELVKKEDWSHQMNTTVNRTITQLVPVKTVQRKPFLGMCSANNMRLALWVADHTGNWFPNPTLKNYFVPFCVVQSGPMANAGIAPGTLIESIDGAVINTANDLSAVLNGKRPGDRIRIIKLNQDSHPMVPGNVVFRREAVDLELGAGEIAQQYH